MRIVLILLLGLGIRVTGLWWGQGYCSIGPSDALEAYSVAVAYGAGEPQAAYLGQPNFNLQSKLPGPLWTMLCFAGLRFWGSIEGAILLVILLNTAAIYVSYLLAERTLGPAGSTWTALLAATLPFAVFYSVSLYNPNVMPLLGGLLFLALWEVIEHERSAAIFWVMFLVLLMPQFHMCITMLLPAIVLVLVLGAARLNLRWLLAGLLAGALLYLPYLRGEASHGWHNTIGMMSGTGHHGWGSLKALTAPLSLLTNWAPQWTDSVAAYLRLGQACFGSVRVFVALNLLSALVGLTLIAWVGWQVSLATRGFWRAPREVFNRSRGLLFLLILVLVPLLCAAASGKNFRSHYALVLFPPLVSLAGWAPATWLRSPGAGRWLGVGLIALTCANAWFMPAMFWNQGRRIAGDEVFIPSFRNLEAVYQQLKAQAGTGRRVFVDVSEYGKGGGRDDLGPDALLIQRYVLIREREATLLSGWRRPPVTYILRLAGQAGPGEGEAAYRGHGIALFAKPATP